MRNSVKTSLFISFCIFRDLPQQKIPRELYGGEDPTIFLCSHVPMERFFDGTDQENSETQEGKGQIRKIQEKQEGKNGGKKKKRFLGAWRFPRLCVLHRLGTLSGEKLKKNKNERVEERKRRDFEVCGGSYTPSVLHRSGKPSGKFLKKKTRWKEWRKEKEEIFRCVEVPIH